MPDVEFSLLATFIWRQIFILVISDSQMQSNLEKFSHVSTFTPIFNNMPNLSFLLEAGHQRYLSTKKLQPTVIRIIFSLKVLGAQRIINDTRIVYG